MNAQKEIAAHTFDKAAAYNKGIILGGYVAYFSVWGVARDVIAGPVLILSALFMVPSVVAFIIFQVITMLAMGGFSRRLSERLLSTPDNFMASYEEHMKQVEDYMIRSQKQQVIALWVTIIPAALSITLLVLAFLVHLIEAFHL